MIFFVSERPDDGADFSIIAIHILGIADTFQECVVVLVLLRIVATLDHSDIASDGFLPGIEAVVVVAGRVVESERDTNQRDTNLSPVTRFSIAGHAMSFLSANCRVKKQPTVVSKIGQLSH